MPLPPTARQVEVLRALHEHGTVRGVADALGMKSIHAPVDAFHWLMTKGLVETRYGFSRSRRYALTDAGLAAIGLRRCTCCEGKGTVKA
jgi:molybdenum-dependent DNA-binding transcriptional regulator ModE